MIQHYYLIRNTYSDFANSPNIAFQQQKKPSCGVFLFVFGWRGCCKDRSPGESTEQKGTEELNRKRSLRVRKHCNRDKEEPTESTEKEKPATTRKFSRIPWLKQRGFKKRNEDEGQTGAGALAAAGGPQGTGRQRAVSEALVQRGQHFLTARIRPTQHQSPAH